MTAAPPKDPYAVIGVTAGFVWPTLRAFTGKPSCERSAHAFATYRFFGHARSEDAARVVVHAVERQRGVARVYMSHARDERAARIVARQLAARVAVTLPPIVAPLRQQHLESQQRAERLHVGRQRAHLAHKVVAQRL